MGAKDLATIIVSSMALLISLVAFILPYFQSKREDQRSSKNQLTDTLEHLTATLLESAKLAATGDLQNPGYRAAVEPILNQRCMYLFQQTVYLSDYLSEQAPNLINFVEYNTIASLSATFGDAVSAERNYRKAINVARDDLSRSAALSSYAQFLFSQRRFEDGRKNLEQAAAIIKEADDVARYRKGLVYLNWASLEKNIAKSSTRAEQALESASGEFSRIDNPALQQDAAFRLDMAKASPSIVPSQPSDPLQAVRSSAAPIA